MRNRFWSKVDCVPGCCWEFKGHVHSIYGYGYFQHNYKRYRAHRLAYTLTKGSIPPGQIVRHKCDNPCCCNPDHLELGTHADNNRDTRERGRFTTVRGTSTSNCTLSEEQVLEIYSANGTHASIGLKYGVSKQQVQRIKARKSWAWLTTSATLP